LTKKSFSQVIGETITDRLKNALQQETTTKEPEAEQPETVKEPESLIVTTAEELEGFYTVRAALRAVLVFCDRLENASQHSQAIEISTAQQVEDEYQNVMLSEKSFAPA
jgi:hypothetical protein